MRHASLAIVALLLGSCFIPARAVQYSPGVYPGNWTSYGISGNRSENVVTSNLTITQVSGANVTAKSTDIYADGSVSSQILWVDLFTGHNNTLQFGFGGFFFAILPGRGVGDGIYGSPSLRIQNMVDRTYVQANRPTNVANITQPGIGSTTYYWDAQSGILTEVLQVYQNRTVALQAMLYATNLWAAQNLNSFPTVILEAAVIGIIGVTGTLLAYFRFRKKRLKKIRSRLYGWFGETQT